MKKCLLFAVLLCVHFYAASQNPTVIKAVGGTATEPKTNSQDAWENNKWNNKFFYQAKGSSCKLAVTDGTDAGTIVIADLGNVSIIATVPAANGMYILTNETVFAPSLAVSSKLWKSDGTTAGTVLLKQFDSHGFSTPGVDITSDGQNDRNYAVIGDNMFFTGFDIANGSEPWITDGTENGTVMLKDIKPGAGPSYADGFIEMNGLVYFRAAAVSTAALLWRTDGTATGTVEIAVPDLTIWSTTIAKVNNKLVFIGNDNFVLGAEPWVSDGTVAGTFMLKDINPGAPGSSTSIIQNIHLRFNDNMVFFMAKNTGGDALWRTDGTVSGTIQLTPDGLNTGTNYSGGGFCAVTNNKTFWINDNSKMYVTDGTPAGTALVNGSLQNAIHMVSFKEAAWFNAGAAGSREMWRSDGTANNTSQYLDIYPGFESFPYGLFVMNNSLYFFANNGSGVKLMRFMEENPAPQMVFNGSASGLWSDGSNWDRQAVPTENDTVFINAGTPFSPVINGTAYVAVLNLAAGATINLPSATDSLVVGRIINANSNILSGNGVLVLMNNSNETLTINGNLRVPELYIRTNTILQNGAITITGE